MKIHNYNNVIYVTSPVLWFRIQIIKTLQQLQRVLFAEP